MKVAQEAIDDTMKEDKSFRTILTFGDFNFPFISWPSRQVHCDRRTDNESQSDAKRQAELFKTFCDENFLENYIETPTRGENILDLVLSNNHTLVNYYKTVVNKKLSDHSTINVSLNFTLNAEKEEEKVMNPYSTKLYEYETNNATDKEWGRFEYVLNNIDENELLADEKPEEQLSRIVKTLEEVADLCLRKKEAFSNETVEKKKRRFIPKQIRTLMRRKEKLSERMMKSRSWHKNYKTFKELEDIETELENSYKKMRKKEEDNAIIKLKKNPKYFYTYAKKFSKTNQQLSGLLREDQSLATSPREQANLLIDQYESVASIPREEYVVEDAEAFFMEALEQEKEVIVAGCEECEAERVHECLADLLQSGTEEPVRDTGEQEGSPALKMDTLFFSWTDVRDAIASIPNGASCGPDGIPAVMLKKAKVAIGRMLAKFLAKSLETGEIPMILKQAFIIPIHKGGSRAQAVNFRPISLTSHIMKTCERVLRTCMVNFMEVNGKLDPRQHGSRSGHSTLSQLLQHQDEILQALENGDNIDSVYLDFSKAYDKVDHGILIHKLRKLGITGKLGRWILGFLSGRRQEVLVRGHKSRSSILISGVPQGSVLGPLLFLIFIGDISEGVTASTLVYVDDSKVKDKVNNEEEVEKLQDNLNTIYEWERNNNMKFNGGKFQVVRYGRNIDLKEDTLYFTGDMTEVIEQVETVKDLGVMLTDDAKFDKQIENVCKKSKQKSGWIMRTFYSRKPDFMRKMFNSLVQPHIDYCSQLWAPAEGVQMDKVENILRNYTKRITAVKEQNYWQRLKSLKMNSEVRRLERYKMIYTWKILEGQVPNCGLKENTTRNEQRGRMVVVPKVKTKASKSVQTLRETSFQVSGPALYNKLPRKLRDMTKCTVDEFKEKLDEFLATIPDEPRCPGLTPTVMTPSGVPTNSLLYSIRGGNRGEEGGRVS